MPTFRPNIRLVQRARSLDRLAVIVTILLEAIRDEEQSLGMAGGWPTERVTGSGGGLTVTERDAEYAWQLSSCREELRDRIDGIDVGIAGLDEWARDRLRWLRIPEGRTPAVLCDGSRRPWEGHQMVWVPHSRDTRNGWHDATCTNSAGRLGLCPTCLLRMNRWRARNGMSWVSDATLAA